MMCESVSSNNAKHLAESPCSTALVKSSGSGGHGAARFFPGHKVGE